MNVFLYSINGSGLIFSNKIREEGHEVIAYIKKPDHKEVWDGLMFKFDNPDEVAEQADLIIFDDNGDGKKADEYRKKGYNVWGGGSFADTLEHDRLFGMEVFNRYGISIPETWDVHDEKGVKDVLKEFKKDEKVVIKLDGEDAAGSAFSFIAKDPETCLEQIEHWMEDGALKKWSGIIQRFVEGIEVSVEAWWDGEKFTTHDVTLEEKKLLAGDLGPSVGCAYNTIVRIDESSKLFKMQLEPIAPLLKKMGYIGSIDTNSIVGKDGTPYALEWTPRIGYDCHPTIAWGNNHGFVNKILYTMGLGGEFEGFGYKGRIWGGLRIYVPPYPATTKDKKVEGAFYEGTCEGIPILDYEKIKDDFWLYDARMNEKGKLVCAGTDGCIGVVFGAGDTAREAGLAAYHVADKVNIPDKSFRALDGYKRAEKALEELKAMRLIKLYPALP